MMNRSSLFSEEGIYSDGSRSTLLWPFQSPNNQRQGRPVGAMKD
ncbi:hypothetical protein [Echinicola soli]|nr:hypothetical protein [Echinicola soli]